MLTILPLLALVAAPQQEVDPVGSLQVLAIPTTTGSSAVSIDLTLEGRPVVLELQRHSVRSGDFRLWVTAPNGSLVEMPAPTPNTWRGRVRNMRSAEVSASIVDGEMTAIVFDEVSETEWQIQPAAGLPAGTYSVAKTEDLIVPAGVCGVANTFVPTQPPPPPAAARGTGLKLCELAIDTDYEFFLDNGGSVTATLNDIESVINRVDIIYTRDVDVTFLITNIIVRSNSNDPYSSSSAGTLLDQFANFWSSNLGFMRRDIAHLFTGRNLFGGTIGVAFLAQVCSSSAGYGLSERFTNNLTSRTGLTAHEIGHNFAAQHCDSNANCRIMCAGLGGCSNDLTRFAPVSISTISNYALGRACLSDLPSPLTLPVTDVANVTVNETIWISRQGTSVSSAALAEVSGGQSYQMNAVGSASFEQDFLISNKILLGGLTDVDLTFHTQARGVASGNSLRVDYLNALGDWNLLTRVTSNGFTENVFTLRVVSLPPAALHNEAQIRFVCEVAGASENWYIDDIELTDQFCGEILPYCFANPNSTGQIGTLSAFGSTVVSDNSLQFFAAGLPAGQFGMLVYGNQQVLSPLGDGFLCVNGTPLFRYGIALVDVFGIAGIAFDQTALPFGSTILPGDVLNFQFWHRDLTTNGANLTTALSVEFCD